MVRAPCLTAGRPDHSLHLQRPAGCGGAARLCAQGFRSMHAFLLAAAALLTPQSQLPGLAAHFPSLWASGSLLCLPYFWGMLLAQEV